MDGRTLQLVLAQAETFASPGAFSDGDARFVNPDERTGPLHFARLWNEDVRGYKTLADGRKTSYFCLLYTSPSPRDRG